MDVPCFGTPEAAADEGGFGFAVDVVAGVWAFATGSGPGGREVSLDGVNSVFVRRDRISEVRGRVLCTL